ncbi:MAG TPA: hypothetical protein VLR26_03280 [Frankiaceae bacterium]|nr:hypothetical protein [Frankiaceae bacterium]
MAAPLLVALGILLARPSHIAALGDDAVIERTVRSIGPHFELLGPYSRFGWHHPGPMEFYLLALPYRLAGAAPVSLPAATLVSNIGCLVGIAILLRRHAGIPAMLLGLIAAGACLLAAAPGFLVNDWNPYLPFLPFTLAVLACWAVLEGDRWALPLSLSIASLCVQSHVGYAVGVGAIAVAVAALALVKGRLSRRQTDAADETRVILRRRWLAPVALSIGVLLLLWLPVVVQQVTHRPGNITLLLRYFSSTSPDWSYTQGLRELSTSVGRLPALVFAVSPRPRFLAPAALPLGFGVFGLAAFVISAVVIAMTRRRALPLVVLTITLAVAVDVAVHHVVGPLFTYLVPFTGAVGVLCWATVGVALQPVARRLSAGVAPVRVAASVAGALALLLVFVPLAFRARPQSSFNDRNVVPLAADIAAWSRSHPGSIRLEAAPTTGLVGASAQTMGVLLRLERASTPVRVSHDLDLTLERAPSAGNEKANWLVQIALTDGTSARPTSGQHVLATRGTVAAYVSRLSN